MSSQILDFKYRGHLVTVVVAVFLAIGCEDVKRRSVRPGAVGVVDGEASGEDRTKPGEADIEETAEPDVPAQTPKKQAPPKYEVTDVTAADAKAGASLKGDLLATPVRALFWGRHQIEHHKMTQALIAFKTLNGHPPKSQEEFMEKIIKDNAINLPELDGGWEYFYDVEAGDLKKRKKT